jgi:nuclear GTP-binding protein
MSKFIGDDNRRFADEQSDEEMVPGEGYDKSDDEVDEDAAAEGEDEVAWDDLFPTAGSSKQAVAGDDSDDGGLDADLAEDDDDDELDLDDDEEDMEDEDEVEVDEEEVEEAPSTKQKGKRGRSFPYTGSAGFRSLIHVTSFTAAVVDLDDEDDKRPTKTPRMTTNKQKSTNYYTTANVKNRNRERKVPKNTTSKNERPKAKAEVKKRMRRS